MLIPAKNLCGSASQKNCRSSSALQFPHPKAKTWFVVLHASTKCVSQTFNFQLFSSNSRPSFYFSRNISEAVSISILEFVSEGRYLFFPRIFFFISASSPGYPSGTRAQSKPNVITTDIAGLHDVVPFMPLTFVACKHMTVRNFKLYFYLCCLYWLRSRKHRSLAYSLL